MADKAAKALDQHLVWRKTLSDWRHQVQPFITWCAICVIAAQPTVTCPQFTDCLRQPVGKTATRPAPL